MRNTTFVLLDAPVFRKQTKADPYPARMDDLDSAIYYSAWNQCIAEALRRFPVDLYHINDYHGCVAQLHLLPQVIPCQGMWSLKTNAAMEEICQVYNLPREVVEKYVQFGEVFNLLTLALATFVFTRRVSVPLASLQSTGNEHSCDTRYSGGYPKSALSQIQIHQIPEYGTKFYRKKKISTLMMRWKAVVVSVGVKPRSGRAFRSILL